MIMKRKFETMSDFHYALISVAVIALFALLVTSCAEFGGPPPPKDTSQAIGQAYAYATTVSHDFADAVTSGAITPQQGRAAAAAIDRYLVILAAARKAYSGTDTLPPDATEAERLLVQFNGLLEALAQELVNEKEKR